MTAKGRCLLFAAAIASAAAIFQGCETESSSTATISLSQTYARIGSGKSLVLSASGGWDYRWEINDSYGYLDRTTGPRVTYTATKDGVTQTIVVKGMFSSDNSSYAQSQCTVVQGDETYAATATGSSTGTTTGGSSAGGGSGGSGGDTGGGSGGSSGGGTSLTISEYSLEMEVGDEETLTASNASGTVTWTRGNDGVVELIGSAGTASPTVKGTSVRVRAVKAGGTKIHAADSLGFAPVCIVTVTNPDSD